jgi:adenine-specific DNA methylase
VDTPRKRLLIEDWLPIAALSEESARERRSMTALPPTYYLHVWFARRPLIASRAAILASLLPADASHSKFLHDLGIHGDPAAARVRLEQATADGIRLGADAYGYSRAFAYNPEQLAVANVVLDPTAGGGSIPFEAARLGATVIANDLNPVASLILKATVELPVCYGPPLQKRVKELGALFVDRVRAQINGLYPAEPNQWICDGYLWARTVTCPYCGGVVPLSPNWKLSASGHGVRLVPVTQDDKRYIRFEIVASESAHSPGTVKGGDGLCPFPDCGRTLDGDEVIKTQAQAGRMGHQLYCVVYKEERIKGHTKAGKPKTEKVRGFRAPRAEDDVEELVRQRIAAKLPLWQARNVIPDELIPEGQKTREPMNFGARKWIDIFNNRQLYGHCVSVEVFQDLAEAATGNDLDRTALVYLALALDKMLNYNAIQVRWHSNREVVAGVFDRHDFSFKWSYAEMAPMIPGLGYDWAVLQTAKSLGELIELLGQSPEHPDSNAKQLSFDMPRKAERPKPAVSVTCRSADDLGLPAASVDCIVMDPPYYDNVMYAELSDFFYVWLKRTAGLIYPKLFTSHLTDKDREAVANPAHFAGQKGGAKNLAGRDYQQRMAAIFREQRRVLKPGGVMTVMFTHKAAGAWDALATGLIEGGFTITASWPINTEAEGSLHIREKSAARSTIFLVCRARVEEPAGTEERYWEDVEPLVRGAVREKVAEFQQAGIGGIDLYLACFGPALQVFTEHWPLTRGTPRAAPQPRQRRLIEEEFDHYAVRPEDALEAARREVKQWRMEQLATIKRQHHLDSLTEWFVLAWDAFRAPRFPADEALKLARVLGLDFDQQVKNQVCEMKGDDVVLWDSHIRHAKDVLGHVGGEHMLDTLHWAAWTGRQHNTGAAKSLIENAKLLEDPTLMTALEAILNVLPPGALGTRKKTDAVLSGAASDFEALENLRRLAFSETVPSPVQLKLALVPEGAGNEETEDVTPE